MAILDLSSKTVVELRKIAKENGVKLSAGLSKAGIIERLATAMDASATPVLSSDAPAAPMFSSDASASSAPAQTVQEIPSVSAEPAPVSPAPAQAPAVQERSVAPQFKAAWHNPAPRYSAKPAYQAPAYPQRPAWQARPAARAPMGMDTPRPVTPPRPSGYTPRFGPDAADPAPAVSQEELRPYAGQPARVSFGSVQDPRPTFAEPARPYDAQRTFGDAAPVPPFGAEGGFAPRSTYTRPTYGAPRRETGYYNPELGTSNPAVSEMLAAGECSDGAGVLELHPDGYGFLRSDSFLPSSKDIYVSMAQIRRFGLRTGDMVTGKTRPQREGDKYAAMLYITQVNGVAPDSLGVRPSFDELTPAYPTRRIDLESHTEDRLDDMRLVDLIAPLGFGQRGLILCPPETGKTRLLQDFANVICVNHPDATVMVLLIDECPEDVTLFREQVKCPVLASTFDQAPENHLRITEMVLERAQRLVEQKQDVVVIVDSLTRLAKTYTTAAAQQGRSLPGMVNPTSLFRAKKLFGAARCVKEGGSLTVIGAMNIENGSRVDDAVVEEFKGTANMELVLDQSVARAGVTPAINLQLSGTKRAEMLLDASQQEGLSLVRSILGATHSATAIPQLLSLMDKAQDNEDFLEKIKGWAQLMAKSR